MTDPPFERCPPGYPFLYVPDGAYKIKDKLYVIPTGEELEVPDRCQCGEGHCFFPNCVEVQQRYMEDEWYRYLRKVLPNGVETSPISVHLAYGKRVWGKDDAGRERVTMLTVDATGCVYVVDPNRDDDYEALKWECNAHDLLPHRDPENPNVIYWLDPLKKDRGGYFNESVSYLLNVEAYGLVGVTEGMIRTPAYELDAIYVEPALQPPSLGL